MLLLLRPLLDEVGVDKGSCFVVDVEVVAGFGGGGSSMAGAFGWGAGARLLCCVLWRGKSGKGLDERWADLGKKKSLDSVVAPVKTCGGSA